jgi:hypothetical protein
MSPLLTTLLTVTGASGFFASRAFLPALLTGLALRFGSHVPLLCDVNLIAHTGAVPPWFTGDVALVALAVLTVLESQQERIPEVAEAFALVSKHLRVSLSILTALGLLQTDDAKFLEAVSVPVAQAGFSAVLAPFPLAVAAGTGAMTWLGAGLRDAVIGWLRDIDPEDALHLQRLFHWAETSWVGVGVVALLLAPILVALILVVVFAALGLWRRRQQAAEQRQLVPCSQCQQPMLPAAISCGHCQAPHPAPRAITWLGAVGQTPVTSIAEQQLALLATHRCRVCASRLPSQPMATVQCPTCQDKPLGALDQREAYLAGVALRLPGVLGLAALAGMVPVLGLAVGLVLVRLRLVAPLAGWLPLGRRLHTKWLLRIGFVALAAIQVVPLVGAALVPLYALLSWQLYQRTFAKQVH